MEKRIGIFDSGVGGLTVLSACQTLMPEAAFYYLGDNGNAPYGSRPAAEIETLVRGAMTVFRALGVDAAVLACNTATAVCAETMRREFAFPVIGMEPAVRLAARHCKHAIVLCTPRTAESVRLAALCASIPSCRFTVLPADGLAGEIERAFAAGESPRAEEFLPRPHPAATFDPAPDGIVLGCTHYLFVRSRIEAFYGLPAFDGNLGTAQRLRSVLSEPDFGHLFRDGKGTGDHHNPPFSEPNRLAKSPVFLGKWAELNEKTYKTNKCFQIFL